MHSVYICWHGIENKKKEYDEKWTKEWIDYDFNIIPIDKKYFDKKINETSKKINKKKKKGSWFVSLT